MSERNAYVIRENPSDRMDAAELRTSIQSILRNEGTKPTYATSVADTSASYLPSVEISDAQKIIVQKKLQEAKNAPPESFELDGGVRGLVERTDGEDAGSGISMQEIKARLGTKLSVNEERALRDIYQNFSSIDRNNDGQVSRSDIESRQRTQRSEQQLEENLARFRTAVEMNRKVIDTDHNGTLSAQEMRVAGGRSSTLSEEHRQALNWGRQRS